MDERLTKSDWIKHGLRTLAGSGMDGLKAGRMAKELNVSRGSFYWHFTDIGDFRSQLLAEWQRVTTDQVILELSEEAGTDRLKLLMERAFTSPDQLGRAVRLWAAQDQDAALVVAQVDGKRTDYLATLLLAAGVPKQQAQERASFIYCAFLGHSLVPSSGDAAMSAPAIAALTALFEA
ncbi:TetR/AcrR family transcriptional regulator [Altererythrobacter sp. ZODW24]|uniref:TetR/AcrR family transcriptional regulator n=1 Tax=Altererythrobacter sp. ZODW24 TaxID=2185142 RepID=UPI000DF7437D|nr:TetR/AcrR family transcriptional regulator [Altererythrobacter sp. ZODW24]